MNKRIKELAEQNGFIHEWMPPGEQHDKLQTLEKFAELIVKEVDRKIGDLMDFTDYTNDTEKQMVELKTLRDARQVIKEHFGVE